MGNLEWHEGLKKKKKIQHCSMKSKEKACDSQISDEII